MITVEQAKNLRYGQVLLYRLANNADGTPMRYRVNGAPKTWKREPGRVEVPLKRGLYEYARLTERDLDKFDL